MNIICFTAHTGKDLDLRYLPDGTAVGQFSAALSSGYGDKRVTTWLNCSIFGKRAETIAPMLKKGASVAITGEFTARQYTSKEGVEKQSLDVRVSDITLLDKRHASDGPEQKQSAGIAPKSFDDALDDLPF